MWTTPMVLTTLYVRDITMVWLSFFVYLPRSYK